MLRFFCGLLAGVAIGALLVRARRSSVSKKACLHEAGHFVHLVCNNVRCSSIRVMGPEGAVAPEQAIDLVAGLRGCSPPTDGELELIADNLLAGIAAERRSASPRVNWHQADTWKKDVRNAMGIAQKFWTGSSSPTGLDLVDAIGVVRELRRRRGIAFDPGECACDIAERAARVAIEIGARWGLVERVAAAVERAPWHRFAGADLLAAALHGARVAAWPGRPTD